MEIWIIAAIARNNVIGNKGELPWNLPKDWKYYLEKTFGQTIIMGTRTYRNMPTATSNNWTKIVVSSQARKFNDALTSTSEAEAIQLAQSQNKTKVFLIGGERIFQYGLSVASKMFLTEIDEEYEGDTFFPRIDKSRWSLTQFSKYHNSGSTRFRFTEWNQYK